MGLVFLWGKMEDKSLNQHTVNPRERALRQTLFSGWVGSLIHTHPPVGCQ